MTLDNTIISIREACIKNYGKFHNQPDPPPLDISFVPPHTTGCPQKKVHFSFIVRRAKVNFFRGHPVDSFKADTIIFQALTKTDYTESIVTESLTLSTPYHQV